MTPSTAGDFVPSLQLGAAFISSRNIIRSRLVRGRGSDLPARTIIQLANAIPMHPRVVSTFLTSIEAELHRNANWKRDIVVVRMAVPKRAWRHPLRAVVAQSPI